MQPEDKAWRWRGLPVEVVAAACVMTCLFVSGEFGFLDHGRSKATQTTASALTPSIRKRAWRPASALSVSTLELSEEVTPHRPDAGALAGDTSRLFLAATGEDKHGRSAESQEDAAAWKAMVDASPSLAKEASLEPVQSHKAAILSALTEARPVAMRSASDEDPAIGQTGDDVTTMPPDAVNQLAPCGIVNSNGLQADMLQAAERPGGRSEAAGQQLAVDQPVAMKVSDNDGSGSAAAEPRDGPPSSSSPARVDQPAEEDVSRKAKIRRGGAWPGGLRHSASTIPRTPQVVAAEETQLPSWRWLTMAGLVGSLATLLVNKLMQTLASIEENSWSIPKEALCKEEAPPQVPASNSSLSCEHEEVKQPPEPQSKAKHSSVARKQAMAQIIEHVRALQSAYCDSSDLEWAADSEEQPRKAKRPGTPRAAAVSTSARLTARGEEQHESRQQEVACQCDSLEETAQVSPPGAALSADGLKAAKTTPPPAEKKKTSNKEQVKHWLPPKLLEPEAEPRAARPKTMRPPPPLKLQDAISAREAKAKVQAKPPTRLRLPDALTATADVVPNQAAGATSKKEAPSRPTHPARAAPPARRPIEAPAKTAEPPPSMAALLNPSVLLGAKAALRRTSSSSQEEPKPPRSMMGEEQQQTTIGEQAADATARAEDWLASVPPSNEDCQPWEPWKLHRQRAVSEPVVFAIHSTEEDEEVPEMEEASDSEEEAYEMQDDKEEEAVEVDAYPARGAPKANKLKTMSESDAGKDKAGPPVVALASMLSPQVLMQAKKSLRRASA
eukprot:TRINITY_DN31591_c0_g1_i1.p1 TRINITY_DN31591_c0_g1~~TRINITY_DN31591_c0_g1_i1.p1  ORF type:complete len:859 (+),score=203.80 TRINITY_DN31591_c0_g1_i1:225-2579(+)